MRCAAMLLCLLGACGPLASGGDDDTGGDDEGGGDGGGSSGPDAPAGPRSVFDPAVTEVLVEIDYEPGAEPFTGNVIGFGDTFAITQSNIERLFAGRKSVALPTTLAGMENIGDVPDEALTVDDLLQLAAAHRSGADTSTRKTYYVLFLTGYFADGNGPNAGVLGVALGDTGVIAIFKDVIDSTQVPATNVARFVEQSTLVHELGHAIGLVDNGVAVTSPHDDTVHGAHCTNDACVMYWQNEGAGDMAAYVQRAVLTGDTILFDAACLADVDALTGGP
ncbi:MAG: hypothetical protein K8M05_25580 [Deltaproteobacteria bacterium]|nr:hypothetical protein [Kofleriaceae bacterium]